MGKFPLFKRLDGSTDVKLKEGWQILTRKRHGKVLWKNAFKMEFRDIMLILIILTLVWSYNHDTQACYDFIKEPCEYCQASSCCKAPVVHDANLSFSAFNVKESDIG